MSYIRELAEAIHDEAWEDGGEIGPHDLPLFLAYALLALVKGADVTGEDVHDAWSTWASDAYDDQHRSLIPFDQLDPLVQAMDEAYVQAIKTVCVGRGMIGPRGSCEESAGD